MLNDTLYFVLNIILSLLGIAFILRAWLYAIRLHPFNPYSQAIIKVTDWAVQPLRRIVPNKEFIDWPSLTAAFIVAYLHVILGFLLYISINVPADLLLRALLAAAITVAKWAANMALWLTLIQAILSWVNPTAPVMPLLQTLTAPLLNPIRRILPQTGAFDFSTLVLLILAQIATFVLQRLSFAVIGI
ncbi:YggT family protein [Paenalcaligenes niemegkensis]|uniref:YggT family protein n=1 Tax=Paenalcaligenes niemegkensis TaxID=2895469 RepID=UPI001EE8F5AB|nr:YggT family protein [Paenalcaligenes niemegkensis]MCQ9615432.1 YggT family protein [Paenalcaligenes niemegkensis]